MDGNDVTPNNTPVRFLRVFAPFFLLLFGVILVTAVFDSQGGGVHATVTAPPVTETSLPSATDTGQTTATPIAAAIANLEASSVAASATPLTLSATLAPDAVAQLIGPPGNSRFPANVPVQFFWQAITSLGEDETFAVFLIGEETERLLGTVKSPNLGTGYQVRFLAKESPVPAGQYSWEVRIVRENDGQVLGRSQKRPIGFLAED